MAGYADGPAGIASIRADVTVHPAWRDGQAFD
jgi:hypothetical protein